MADNRVMLITGASSGIGLATAQKAARAGFRLALAARRKDRLGQLREELETESIAIECDVQDWDSQQAAVAQTLNHFGQLDVVFANAGRGLSGGGYAGSDPSQWRDALLTNVLGAALTVRASLAALKASRGHIVLTGSVAGRRTLTGSFYGITKWAISGMAGNLREELRGTGIRVTLLEPGMVDTPFFDSPKPDALKGDEVADTVMFALTRPPGVEIHDLCVLPTPPLES